MSTAVDVYSVPVNRLRAVLGSKDKELLASEHLLKGFFKNIDRIAENRDEEEDRPPDCATAYRQIINGEPYLKGFGYVYGYAYHGLCMVLGTDAERPWNDIARSHLWFEEIDTALAEMQIKLNITNLLYRGSVIDIPEPDDYPALGWWSADEVAAASIAFKALDLNQRDEETNKVVERVADAIDDIRSWIALASHRPGDWLIGVQS